MSRSDLMKQPTLGYIPPPIGTRSTCGVQVRSTFHSNPAYGFGAATRETAQKRFISDEHKSKELPGWTPGPGQYKHHVTTGKQSESSRRTEPRYSFGTSARFDKTKSEREGAVPGPGAYLI